MANLYKGSSGPEVKTLQQRLNAVGGSLLPPLVADGIFGNKTHARVIEYQKSKGLTPDGVVGPMTKAALGMAGGGGSSVPQPSSGGGGGGGDIVGAVVGGTAGAIQTWKSMAALVGVTVNGPIATGGSVVGPNIQGMIASAVIAKLKGEDQRIGVAAAAGIGAAFAGWQGSVRVPGLPWYPGFAAMPMPVAPPTPNIPSPLTALQSASGMISSPGAIQGRIAAAGALPSSRADAAALVQQIADQVAARFQIFLVTTMVQNVLGSGTVPTFAPPYVPVGPVIGGIANGVPGCFR